MCWAQSCCSSELSAHKRAPQHPPTSCSSATDVNQAFCTSEDWLWLSDWIQLWVLLMTVMRRKIWSVLWDFMTLKICAASYKKKKVIVSISYALFRAGWQSLWLNNAMNENHFKTLPSHLLPPTISYMSALMLICLGVFWITNSFVCFHYQITTQNSN